MRRIILLFVALSAIIGFSAASTMAQTAPNLVDVGVNLTCGSITVTLNSDYDRPIIAQVYVGNVGLTAWNLVDDIGNFVTAGPNGSGSRTYFFIIQPANTQVSYSIRVYDDVTNNLVKAVDAIRDCDGSANNAPPPASTQTTNTGSATATFLASCGGGGSIIVQPIGGISFTISATQIAQGTAMAIANNQNMTITSTNGVTAIGTPANAVQLVGSSGYSITIPASSCAVTVSVPTTSNNSAAAQAASLSCSSIPADAVNTHVVRAGENLFRIGLRYGVHFTRLAAYNGIPDATRIFVGQCIAIPPA